MEITLGPTKKAKLNLFQDAVYRVKAVDVKQTNWNNRIFISPEKSIRKKKTFQWMLSGLKPESQDMVGFTEMNNN